MKFNKAVTSDRSKNRKAHFTAPKNVIRKLMSAPLSKELREKYGVRSVPIRKDDEVKIVRGSEQARSVTGKVICVYRKKQIIHVQSYTTNKQSGVAVQIPVRPSNVVITKLFLNAGRKALLERKAAGGKVQKATKVSAGEKLD